MLALILVPSTSRAAMLAEKEATTAAIASKFTLEYHKLNILAEHIEDVADNHVNLTLIESRPCKHKIWEYFFFLEIDGNKNELKLKKTFKVLEQNKFTYKILGSFSKAV